MTTAPAAPPIMVDWLLQHAFAGRLAVSVPGSSAPRGGPKGPFPAGVSDVIEHLVRSYDADAPPDRDHWVFLLGRPSNGKSEALKHLIGRLGMRAPPVLKGGRAPRSIGGRIPRSGAWARLVNDASIPRDGRLAGSLARDLGDAFEALEAGGGSMFFANVNRGILVEEERRSEEDPDPIGRIGDLLAWLNEAASGLHTGDAALSYYARKAIPSGSKTVVVHAICLDAVSLFEPQPSQDASLDFSVGDDPVVARYAPLGGLRLLPGARRGAIASILVGDVASAFWEDDGCARCDVAPLCPFRANVRWLRDPALNEAFIEAGRASEVAANRRMTYRDLLGHLSLAILGPSEPEWLDGEHPCSWVRRVALPAGERAIVQLARHRIYAAIFPPPNPSAKAWGRRGPGRPANDDPYAAIIEDFGPGRQGERSVPFRAAMHRLDPSRSLDSWGGAREKVVEAAEAMHVDPPTAALAAILPVAAVSEIENRLDAVVAKMAAGGGVPSLSRRRRAEQAVRWRSVLLLRQVALARGELSDIDVVDAWLSAQAGVPGDGDLGPLFSGLQCLLLPKDGPLRLAPYRARNRTRSRSSTFTRAFRIEPCAPTLAPPTTAFLA